MDYHKPNQEMTTIAAAVPNVVSMLDQNNTSPGAWYADIALANSFFLITVTQDHEK